MWSRLTGGNSSASNNRDSKDDESSRRRRTGGESTRARRDRDSDLRSVVSSTSTRKPSRRDTAPSSIASFATAFDEMPRARANDDLYDDPRDSRDERYSRRRDGRDGRDERPSSYAESSASTSRRDRSRSRDRDDKDRKKSKDKDKDKDKDRKSDKRRSTRSERSGSASQAGGYRGDIVDSPREPTRSFSGQIASGGFSQFPGQAGAPVMSGALPPSSPHIPPGEMSSHVQDQFPGQDPMQYTSSALPGRNPFGAAAEYYNDQGESVMQQPGVRPDQPSVIIGQDTPHLMSASAHPNPVADTGSGAAADFYAAGADTTPSRPPRPSSMPGAFNDDEYVPAKPPRPSSKPDKPGKFGSAASVAGGAALGYAMGHSSSNTHQSNNYHSSNQYNSTSYTNGGSGPGPSASLYNQGENPSTSATNGSGYIPSYSQAMDGAPPPKPPRPGKPEKHSSSSNAGLYTAGAAGLAAYALHQHNSHSNSHDHSHSHTHNDYSSTPGAFPGQNYNGNGSPPNPYMAGGMAQRHQHTGPVSRFVDWWKDYEDVQKMEEYTEYIGVCKGCFDPRSSVLDAPRKHHYNRRRSSEYMRPSGGIEKQSRYSLHSKKSHSSLSSGDERRKKTSGNAAGWVAAGLGGIGLVKAGKAVLGVGQNDFDDTYSIKSGRDRRSRISGHSRSRSRDRKSYAYGRSEIRHRSRSRDRMSQMSVGVTKDRKDYKITRRRSHSGSRASSSSRDGKSGFGTAIGAGLAGAALGAALGKKRPNRSRSKSPKKATFVRHRRDSSDDELRRRKSQQLRRKSSRSSASGASVIDISNNQPLQGGFLGGFFSAPPPKLKRRTSASTSHKKKKKGFFTFGNGSASSSDSEMAFGTGYVKRKRRSSPKRRNSEERLKATLAGLGATAAAIAAAKAARAGKHPGGEVVAVKHNGHRRKSSDRPRPASRYGDDEWEDLPDDDTSDSASDGGLVYGDYDWRKGKSQESLASNGSGTNKWGWRWGFGKKKRRSSENLYDNIASTSLVGPVAAGTAGAITGAAIGTQLGRHDSESSSVHTLQTVYPVASANDPTTFDARRTSSFQTPQPLITSGPGPISLQQPQPIQQVPGAIYSTQAPSQASFVAPVGPPVFSQNPGSAPYQTQYQSQDVIAQPPLQQITYPGPPRRANSSPIRTSSWKRDAAIAGLAATAGAAALAASKSSDRPSSDVSNVRFNLTKEQADKEARERRKEQDRQDEEENRRREQQRREDDIRKDEEDRRRREQLVRDEEARRIEEDRLREQLRREDEIRQEEERRHSELARQQEEARRFMETERLAKIEADRVADEQRRRREEMFAREAREAEERERQERELKMEAQRRADLEAEAQQMRKERREAERRENERAEAARREAEIREDAERRLREREAQEYAERYDSDRNRRKLEQQPTGNSDTSVVTAIRRREKELEDREHGIIRPDDWKSSAGAAVAAGAAAAITSAAISSHKDKDRDQDTEKKSKSKSKSKGKDRERESERQHRRDSTSTVATVVPISSKTYDPPKAITYEPYRPETTVPTRNKVSEQSVVQAAEPSSALVTYAPSNIQQDYADDDIFDPNLFKKQTAGAVLKDWEDRYNEKPVSQADFFAPKELLNNDNLPKVHPVDPNEGAKDIQVYEAHDEPHLTHPMSPPYPASYAFTATRDGRPSIQQAWPVPSLVLIQPTPPGSRAPSVRSVSLPPSPNIEPVVESKEEPKPVEANKARSRVSWGENQFHHFEVPTPDSYNEHEQFISDRELKNQNKDKMYSHDEVTVEHESPKSGEQSITYQPYRPPTTYQAYKPPQTSQAQEPSHQELSEIAPSTQYVQDEKDSDWDSVVTAVSKKSSKREKKKAKAAAAAAAAGTAASVVAASSADWEEFKRQNASTISNPFSDKHAAPSTIAPSTIFSSIPSSSSVYQTPSYESSSDLDVRKGLDNSMTGPGSVISDAPTETTVMHVPGSFDESPTEKLPQTVEDEWASAGTKSRRGKKTSASTDDIVEARDTSKRAISDSASERGNETVSEIESTSSKKERKKKKKSSRAATRMSIDSWEESDESSVSSPTIERDIRDIEPSYISAPTYESTIVSEGPHSQESGSSKSNKAAAAAMAGGFAAIVGATMKQDQDRMASDLEHARQSFQSADSQISRNLDSSQSNGSRAIDGNDKSNTIPSMVFGLDEPPEVKTPKRKKEKRHSSGLWSPTIGSPLRTETKYEDYIGSPERSTPGGQQPTAEVSKSSADASSSAPGLFTPGKIIDSGHHASDDLPRKENTERDSDEFFSAGSEEREKSRNKAPESEHYNDSPPKSRTKYEEEDSRSITSPKSRYDDDTRSVGSSRSKHDDDDAEREERRRRRRETKSESREQSRDRGYDFDEGSERRRRHRRREIEDPTDDWDTRSTVSEARSEANGERRRKHRRRESERDGSTESKTRSRSSAASEPGDLGEERKSSRRRSKRDGDDDNASVISSSSRYDEDRSPKKEKEKRSSGLFGLFSKSKESLVETPSKSSRSRDDEDDEGKRRRRKHRSDRGSTYGSDDDDVRSTISSSSRREKRSSRSDRGDGDRGESYDDKVHRSSYTR